MAYQPFPEFDAWELQFIQDVPYAAVFEEEARKNNVSALLLVSMTQQECCWVEDVEGPPIYIIGEDGIIRYYGKATGLMQEQQQKSRVPLTFFFRLGRVTPVCIQQMSHSVTTTPSESETTVLQQLREQLRRQSREGLRRQFCERL